MTTRIACLAAALAALVGAFEIATAPALWWMSDAEKSELIAKAEAQHGPEAAAYLKSITR